MSWPTARLADHCEVITKGTTPTTLGYDFTDTGVPFLRVQNIEGGRLIFARGTLFIDENTHRSLERSQIRPGDVLVSIAGTIGRAGVVPDDAPPLNCNQAVAIVRAREHVHRPFLRHWLESGGAQAQMRGATVTGTISNLSLTQLGNLRLPLPPIAEQRRIAEILDNADGLRAKRRTSLAQLDTLTQSIFLEMFGDPGTNPKGWPRSTLRELGKVKTGGTPPSAKTGMFGGPIPFVTPGDLESNATAKRSVTEAGAAECETVRQGATLVCCIGATIGKVGRAEVRSAFNQQINAVEWGASVHDAYGYEVLRFFKPTIIAWGASTTLPILKKSAFEKIEIPIPTIELQTEFAARSAQVDRLERSSRTSLAHCDELFASLQARAFEGVL